jgi:hypothetical protein
MKRMVFHLPGQERYCLVRECTCIEQKLMTPCNFAHCATFSNYAPTDWMSNLLGSSYRNPNTKRWTLASYVAAHIPMLHAPEIGFPVFWFRTQFAILECVQVLNVVHAVITWQRMLEQDLPKFSRKHKSGLAQGRRCFSCYFWLSKLKLPRLCWNMCITRGMLWSIPWFVQIWCGAKDGSIWSDFEQ